MRILVGSKIHRLITSLSILGIVICTPILMALVNNLPTETQDNTIFLNRTTIPPCVGDEKSLPIFRIMVKTQEGDSFRGTAFLVNQTQWVTAGHVVDGNIDSLSIHMPTKAILGNIKFIDDSADIAIIETEPVLDYSPMVIKYEEHKFLEEIWSIGYPGWAINNRVISSGKVIGNSEEMIFTSAPVMTGMSGGPTVSCNGDQLEVSSVIAMFAKQLLSSERVLTEHGYETVNTYMNTGESFSSLLNRLDHTF